ncbi:MAG: MBL fold metallo-hydrolase [Desulfobacteraceae bacterium]|jgi:glyoxylase-like metal-dependent hydrolase (beta-lactamase superfamily II)|nr:MAG: MBL fold metallo-hydrolase [Desulfobacteraceae bacterium]
MNKKKELTEKHFGSLWFLPGDNYGRYPFCHSIYIEGPGILIDPASNRERLIEIKKHYGVSEVWLSHSHEDHFMHLDLFDGLPLSTSELEAKVLSNMDLFMDAYEIPPGEYQYWQPLFEEQFHFKPREVSKFLKGGQVISTGAVTIEIINAPGHTPGHTAFFFHEPSVLFLGDYDLTRFGPWYGDKFSSLEDTVASVEALKKIQAKVWMTGHETGIFEEEPGELWDEYLNVIWRREERILELLSEPRSLQDLMSFWIIYGKPKEPRIFFELGERLHIGKHLERLLRLGMVTLDNGKYIRV